MRGLDEQAPGQQPGSLDPSVTREAREVEAGQVETRLLRTLLELSGSAERSFDPDELVRLAADKACELLEADAVALYLWDDGARLLRLVYSKDPHAPSGDDVLGLGEGAAGQAVLRRQPVLVPDYTRFEHAVAWAIATHVRSVNAVPLLVGDRPVGALVVRFYREREIGHDEERILTLLAQQVAPALEAARLYATTHLEHRHERALREITQALAVHREEREVLKLAVNYSSALLDAPYARVWLVEPDGRLHCAAAEGYVHVDTFARRLAQDSTSGRAARQQVLNLDNAPGDASWFFHRDFGLQTGLGAYLGAGLWRAGESLGVLEVMRSSGRRFRASEEQLLVTLANTVAVAVSNSRAQAAFETLAHEAERRAAEVSESELLLRSIYEAIGSGILVFDANGGVIHANDAAQQILGRTADELQSMQSSDFRPGILEDGTPLAQEDRPFPVALRTRQPVRKMVFGIRRPDGQRRWIETDAVPLCGADGHVTRVISSFIDITERKRSEEALRERDRILEAVAFAAEQLLGSPDWEQVIDRVLAKLGAATGVSRVHIVPAATARAHQSAIHQWTADGVPEQTWLPADQSYLSAAGLGRWEPILREGGVIHGPRGEFPDAEQRALTDQGVSSLAVVPIFAGQEWWGFIAFDDHVEERHWAAGVVEVLRTAAGTLGAAILRRAAEAERLQLVSAQAARAEAEAAQQRLAFLAGASDLLAASLDYETTMQSVAGLIVPYLADYCVVDMLERQGDIRRVAMAHADRSTEEWLREVSRDQQVDPNSMHPVARVLRTSEPLLLARLEGSDTPQWVRDARAAQPQRPIHFHSAMAVPLLTRNGIVGALTCFATTERAAYERRDLSLAQDLGRRCAVAIDNARLYREAREAVSVRDEFLSVAAHELKTPMTSLRGYAQLLGREFERDQVLSPQRARRAAGTIQVQADKLARLVAQLLDISRIQSGKLAIERRPTDLRQLVLEVVDAAQTQIKEHTIITRLPDELWLLLDPLRIEQVVRNLVDNAIKYSPDGGQIDVELDDDPSRHEVRMIVRDRGVGVPLEHRAHIFDRFYQAHAGGALTSMAGMGLGLYISRQIVELHGGTIEASFPPDESGTSFLVTLPRAP